MFWLIRLYRFAIALIFGAIAYGIVYLINEETHQELWKGGFAFLVWLIVMVWSWIEFRIKIPNHKSINTNRHAFVEIRNITESLPSWFKTFLSLLLSPLVNIRKGTGFGLGGSSNFASVVDHWGHQYKKSRGDIFLGCSVWDHESYFGQQDDKGGSTFSEPRNGKGTSFIIPNLMLYKGSALVLDGKNGENFKKTAHIRRALYGNVLCIDPYGKTGAKSARFNPLAGLDPHSPTIIDDLAILGDALVIKSGHAKEDHFADGGERLIKALIGHMISTQNKPNLADLRDMIMRIMSGDKALLHEMANNNACHGVIKQAAVLFTEDTTEVRNFISNAVKATEWLTKPTMREVLSASDFSFEDLKTKQGISLYLVLDADTVQTNAPFLRLFVNMAIRALRKGSKPEIPVLFLLDEFYSLGRMDQLSRNIDEIPGYGVKLWPVMHRIGQLQELYKQNWSSFLGGTQVYFGLNQDTAEFVETEMGQRGFERDSSSREDVIYTGLLSAKEIREITSNAKEWGNQIVLRADGAPLLLKRVNYYSDVFIPEQMEHKNIFSDVESPTDFLIDIFFLGFQYICGLGLISLVGGFLLFVFDSDMREHVFSNPIGSFGFIIFFIVAVILMFYSMSVHDRIKYKRNPENLKRREQEEIEAARAYKERVEQEQVTPLKPAVKVPEVAQPEPKKYTMKPQNQAQPQNTSIDFMAARMAQNPKPEKKAQPQQQKPLSARQRMKQGEADYQQYLKETVTPIEPELEMPVEVLQTIKKGNIDKYPSDVDTARSRWMLPKAYTDNQVDKRYPKMLDKAAAHEIDLVNHEYGILKKYAA
jgi:type IV secretion system protein VirD4